MHGLASILNLIASNMPSNMQSSRLWLMKLSWIPFGGVDPPDLRVALWIFFAYGFVLCIDFGEKFGSARSTGITVPG
jgi:hypothetical protein